MSLEHECEAGADDNLMPDNGANSANRTNDEFDASTGGDNGESGGTAASLTSAQQDADANFVADSAGAPVRCCGTPQSSAPLPSGQGKTWIEYRVVDDAGHPVSGLRCRLKSTDGTMTEGVTDEQGSIRLDGIDPGTCKLWLLEVDKTNWRPA